MHMMPPACRAFRAKLTPEQYNAVAATFMLWLVKTQDLNTVLRMLRLKLPGGETFASHEAVLEVRSRVQIMSNHVGSCRIMENHLRSC
eukprot:7277644-Pyramimonas_sp.AAC.1